MLGGNFEGFVRSDQPYGQRLLHFFFVCGILFSINRGKDRELYRSGGANGRRGILVVVVGEKDSLFFWYGYHPKAMVVVVVAVLESLLCHRLIELTQMNDNIDSYRNIHNNQ